MYLRTGKRRNETEFLHFCDDITEIIFFLLYNNCVT